MYSNIDQKIKGFAEVCAFGCLIIGIILLLVGAGKYLQNVDYLEYASVYGGAGYGFSSLTERGDIAYSGRVMFVWGIIVAVTGFFGSWLIYGYGELIGKVCYIADNMKKKDETENGANE